MLAMYNKRMSIKEYRLIDACGLGHLCEYLEATALFKMCVEKVFIENQSGPHVESLRRVVTAFHACSPYRLTEEFEQLIQLNQES